MENTKPKDFARTRTFRNCISSPLSYEERLELMKEYIIKYNLPTIFIAACCEDEQTFRWRDGEFTEEELNSVTNPLRLTEYEIRTI